MHVIGRMEPQDPHETVAMSTYVEFGIGCQGPTEHSGTTRSGDHIHMPTPRHVSRDTIGAKTIDLQTAFQLILVSRRSGYSLTKFSDLMMQYACNASMASFTMCSRMLLLLIVWVVEEGKRNNHVPANTPELANVSRGGYVYGVFWYSHYAFKIIA